MDEYHMIEIYVKQGNRMFERMGQIEKLMPEYWEDALIRELKRTEEFLADHEFCSDCGSLLIVRRSKKGKEFYGCTSFPKCRYTKSVEA
jgi:hypothetical protein